MNQVLSDKEAMLLAIEEAKKGLGWVAPNPVVGCCVVDSDNRFLASGAHLKYGEKHAEANALGKIKDQSKLSGAKVFVTLEPCAHVGNQPSCAHTLARLPIEKVVYLIADPNPLAEGGEEVLKKAGVNTERMPELELMGEGLAEVFLTNQRLGRSHFHLKVGSSLDGLIANAAGQSQWITGEESRHRVQKMRGQCDAVLVGRRTFEVDSPRLNSRDECFKDKVNWAIVLDPEGKLIGQLETSPLSEVRPLNKIVWVTGPDVAARATSVRQLKVKKIKGESLDLKQLGEELLKIGVCSVLIEGGAQTIGAFLNQGVLDRVSVFQSLSLIGAKSSLAWSSAFETIDLAKRPTLHQPETTMCGDDLFITGIVRKF
jgi:diaminohydroxyphosphoribosylaminopyrimidine deaminase/5-amino-6-(5-phosphoribosylamino)uracil reductase